MTSIPGSPGPNDSFVLHPKGVLNQPVAPALAQELVDLVDSGKTRLVIDLVDVPTIDSAAIGALIRALKLARAAGGDLRIVAPSVQVAEVLRMTKLINVLPAYSSVEAAFETT